MISIQNFGLMLYGGVAIAAGQALMSILSRSLLNTHGISSIFWQSVSAWSTWGSVFLYGSGFLSMFVLLRHIPLAQASIGIWGITLVANIGFTALMGQTLSFTQYIGIAFVFFGMIFLLQQQ